MAYAEQSSSNAQSFVVWWSFTQASLISGFSLNCIYYFQSDQPIETLLDIVADWKSLYMPVKIPLYVTRIYFIVWDGGGREGRLRVLVVVSNQATRRMKCDLSTIVVYDVHARLVSYPLMAIWIGTRSTRRDTLQHSHFVILENSDKFRASARDWKGWRWQSLIWFSTSEIFNEWICNSQFGFKVRFDYTRSRLNCAKYLHLRYS